MSGSRDILLASAIALSVLSLYCGTSTAKGDPPRRTHWCRNKFTAPNISRPRLAKERRCFTLDVSINADLSWSCSHAIISSYYNVIMRILLYNVNRFNDIILAGNIIVRSQAAVGTQMRSLANRPTAVSCKANYRIITTGICPNHGPLSASTDISVSAPLNKNPHYRKISS